MHLLNNCGLVSPRYIRSWSDNVIDINQRLEPGISVSVARESANKCLVVARPSGTCTMTRERTAVFSGGSLTPGQVVEGVEITEPSDRKSVV